MERLILVIFLLKILLCLSHAVTVTQDQPFVLLRDGDPMEDLTCTHDGSSDSSYYMYWYQQKTGGALVLIAVSVAAGDDAKPEKAFEGTWVMTRPTNEKSVLKRNGTVGLQDSAVYFCAARTGGSAAYFGAGTVLSVLEQGKERKDPNVTIFNPNPQELKDHEHASFVCVASGFYPEHVSITWKVNGEKRQTYDQNKAIENSDNSYSISRRLSVTKDEYFNPSNTFRCEASFPGEEDKPASMDVQGKSACSKSRDQYRIEVNKGKLSYILVLCKSALYAIVVAVIMLRKKMKGSTY